jgi:hypothetical protein
MVVDGNWSVRYSQMRSDPFISEDRDAEEMATITLSNGKVSGSDPNGGTYNGRYFLVGTSTEAAVTVTKSHPEAEPIFEGVKCPFSLEVHEMFTSPDYFSMQGDVSGTTQNRFKFF